jgi:hypothetical protein
VPIRLEGVPTGCTLVDLLDGLTEHKLDSEGRIDVDLDGYGYRWLRRRSRSSEPQNSRFVGAVPGISSAHASFRHSDPVVEADAMTERITMPLNEDDITTSANGGEGTADGGSNPEGHDGGADGTAGGEGPADGGSNPEGHDGGADGTAGGEGAADGGSNPEGHDGGADGSA